MAIDGGFFVKHIRPWGLAAIDQMSAPDGVVWQYLAGPLRMQQPQITQLLTGWAQTAMLQVDPAQVGPFVATASSVAIARWDEHGQTQASTVLFMPNESIQALSQWGDRYRNQTSDVMLSHPVPIAVTVFRDPGTQPQVHFNVDTLPDVVVSNGLVVHMSPLPGD